MVGDSPPMLRPREFKKRRSHSSVDTEEGTHSTRERPSHHIPQEGHTVPPRPRVYQCLHRLDGQRHTPRIDRLGPLLYSRTHHRRDARSSHVPDPRLEFLGRLRQQEPAVVFIHPTRSMRRPITSPPDAPDHQKGEPQIQEIVGPRG